MNNSSKNGKKTLSEIYTRLMGYESKNLDYSRNRSSLLNSINKNTTLLNNIEYFSRQTEPDFQLPNSIFNAINHFEKGLESFSTTQTVIISSLLGATVAAILTAIGTYLIIR